MKVALILISFIFTVTAGLFLYSWYRLHTQLNLHIKEDPMELPAGWNPKTQFIINSDKQKLAYWYFPVTNPKAVVILIHGYSNPGGKRQMTGNAKYLHDAGYSTVLLDLCSFGESDGNKITFGVNEWKDVEAVYDKVKTFPENKNKKVGFFGISMGAAIAIVTAGKTGKGNFVIASVPYANFNSLFHYQIAKNGFPPTIFYPFLNLAARIELGNNYEEFTPLIFIKRIHVPVFLMSAKQDEYVNYNDAIELYNLANEPKELWQADAQHDISATLPKEFKTRVLAFLTEYAP